MSSLFRIGGDAGEFYQFLGQYDAINGVYSEGRMIYKSNRGKYLRLKSGKNVWTLCDDIECNNAKIASGGGANSMNPADHRQKSKRDFQLMVTILDI